MLNIEKVLKRETIYDGFFKFEKLKVGVYDKDSNQIKTVDREVVTASPAVVILPVICNEGEYLVGLTRQYRHAVCENRIIMSPPAGRIEFGEGILNCGLRELEEEMGLTSNRVILLNQNKLFSSDGMTNEGKFLMLALDCNFIDNPKREEGENVDSVFMKMKDFYEKVDKYEFGFSTILLANRLEKEIPNIRNL